MAIRAHPVNDRIDRTLSKRPPEPTPVPDIKRPAVHPAKILQRATLAPNSLRPDDLLLLQRTLGNRAVGQLLAQLASPIQAKLKVNAPGDEYEREADRVADEVTRMPAVQQEALEENEEPEIMTKCVPAQTAGGEFEQQLRAARGQGQPLPAGLREEFETKLGADFSRVRVHTDALADQLNQSVQAKAFTTRQDVFFRQGAYDPVSRSGQAVIAHELTHVVQQAGGRPIQGQAPAGAMVQREIDMDDDDWEYDPSLFEKKATATKQFKSDAAIWFQTLFAEPGQNDGTPAERQQLSEQQEILKRNFLAQAVLGVQAGNQNTGQYQPLENVQGTAGKVAGSNIPLAALSSHGGRYGYEAPNYFTGRAFRNWLLTGDSTNPGQNVAGLFDRNMTHSQAYDATMGRWIEGDSVQQGLGMNIAFGGYGNVIQDLKGRPTTVGFEGKAQAQNRHKNKMTDYQLGSALIKHDEATANVLTSRLMIGFEGTAPHMKNQLGGEHGFQSTAKKMLGGEANATSLTGQDKAGAIGLPSGMGALKSDITPAKMQELSDVTNGLNRIRNQPRGEDVERHVFKRLLASTTQQERDEVIKLMKERKVAKFARS